MCLMGVPEKENKGDCEEAVFKEIRCEDLPELIKIWFLKLNKYAEG